MNLRNRVRDSLTLHLISLTLNRKKCLIWGDTVGGCLVHCRDLTMEGKWPQRSSSLEPHPAKNEKKNKENLVSLCLTCVFHFPVIPSRESCCWLIGRAALLSVIVPK